MIFLLIIVFFMIAIIEIPPLIKKKYWYEFVVFLFFLGTSIFISTLIVLGISKPNPTGWLDYFFRYVLHLSYK